MSNEYDPAPMSEPSPRRSELPTSDPESASDLDKIGDIAASAGLCRINFLAWRDLDDPEAGGSEVHVARIASIWARAGIDVRMRTSNAAGHPQVAWRDGYRVVRKAGRYLVFPRAALSEMMGWHGRRDGLIEIWNGMPFFSPVWAVGPRVVWLHHVHAEMWRMTLPARLAALGDFIESRAAPRFYHHTPIVTLSESSKRELVEDLGFHPERVTVVPPGIDSRFSPGGRRSERPLVVGVGRLVPVKRFEDLIDVFVALRRRVPDLEAVIAGDGYCRADLEARVRAADAEDWLRLPGRVSDDELLDLYRRAWVLGATSVREGWGMTITEAAACATPAVATRISGHTDAIEDGVTGVLTDSSSEMVEAIAQLLDDERRRGAMSLAATERARTFVWNSTARATLEVLAAEARRRRSSR